MTGYVLTKWRFKGDSWVFLFLLFGCFIPFQAILLPMARTLRSFRNIKFNNWISFSSYSLWNYVLPHYFLEIIMFLFQ
jgi:ABC-type glycerol-3-phosphate transport system permease component